MIRPDITVWTQEATRTLMWLPDTKEWRYVRNSVLRQKYGTDSFAQHTVLQGFNPEWFDPEEEPPGSDCPEGYGDTW